MGKGKGKGEGLALMLLTISNHLTIQSGWNKCEHGIAFTKSPLAYSSLHTGHSKFSSIMVWRNKNNNVRMRFCQNVWRLKAKKRKLLCCPQVEFLNIWVSRSANNFFLFFLKHPKVQHLGAFSTFFLKKGEKTPSLKKIGCIPDPNFFHFIFGDGSVAEGNTTFFFLA